MDIVSRGLNIPGIDDPRLSLEIKNIVPMYSMTPSTYKIPSKYETIRKKNWVSAFSIEKIN
jgi:hypothetical protein